MRFVEQKIDNEKDMLDFGRRLAESLPSALVIYLSGELGAGKTTLTRGVVHGLGFSGRVKSPTYTLIEPYEIGERLLYHLDLYRLVDPEELEYLGVRDLFDQQIVLLIEWPEKGEAMLPQPDLRIQINYRGDGRNVLIQAASTTGDRFLEVFVK